jgi:hypothetical protein
LALAGHQAIAKQNLSDQLSAELGTCCGTLNGGFDGGAA